MQTHNPLQDRLCIGRGLDGDHAPRRGETGEEFGELPCMCADVDRDSILRQEGAEQREQIAVVLLGRRLPGMSDPLEPPPQRRSRAHAVSFTNP